jgi:hypothetical protein
VQSLSYGKPPAACFMVPVLSVSVVPSTRFVFHVLFAVSCLFFMLHVSCFMLHILLCTICLRRVYTPPNA